jgi:hypothetical protein
VNCWPPERYGTAQSTFAQSTAVSPPSFCYPRKPSTLVELPKNSLQAAIIRPPAWAAVSLSTLPSLSLVSSMSQAPFNLTVLYP